MGHLSLLLFYFLKETLHEILSSNLDRVEKDTLSSLRTVILI
ncbi:MAG: hypothetical protein JETT_0097 [Candidatus Jettenia ecosi]|uniref:Uncharacterized protein n=1 Tax=Candidatus Jettenia ecosi TaxID=2494326 RepID=A0A533QFU4_9BACT|nr:MAG: hypothetical protein JETT_0097 [Candidatus Jettenia ecosi]